MLCHPWRIIGLRTCRARHQRHHIGLINHLAWWEIIPDLSLDAGRSYSDISVDPRRHQTDSIALHYWLDLILPFDIDLLPSFTRCITDVWYSFFRWRFPADLSSHSFSLSKTRLNSTSQRYFALVLDWCSLRVSSSSICAWCENNGSRRQSRTQARRHGGHLRGNSKSWPHISN